MQLLTIVGRFSSVVALQLHKLETRVQFPPPTLNRWDWWLSSETLLLGDKDKDKVSILGLALICHFTTESLKHTRSRNCVREVGPDHKELWHCTRAVQSVDPINPSMWTEKGCGGEAVILIPAREI